MKGKFSHKLLSLLLAGIIAVTGAELPAYAAGGNADTAETELETTAAATETQPVSSAESTETPSTEASVTETSSAETPSTESSGTKTSSEETSSTETSGTEPSQTETPSTEASGTEPSQTETPSTELSEPEYGTKEGGEETTETIQETSETDETEKIEETDVTASQDEWLNLSDFVVNPFYAEMYYAEQMEAPEELLSNGLSAYAQSEPVKYDTKAAAVTYMRDQMLKREVTIAFSFPAGLVPQTPSAFSEFEMGLVSDATSYSDKCSGQDGDALAWAYTSYMVVPSFNRSDYRVTLTFNFTYSSTYEQEQQLTAKVEEVIAGLELDGKSDYEKVRAIHDYICDHVDYDKTSDALTRYSAYGALINGKAVCQGYAVLFYRMCREAGLSVRIISGKGNGGPHAWNIVRIGGTARAAGTYYNVDCTWDGQGTNTHHTYFMKSDADFVNHDRDAKYNTPEFRNEFPMTEQSYKLTNSMNVDNLQGKSMWIYDGKENNKTASMAASGRPKVLIFIQTTCTRSKGTVQSIAREQFGNSADIYVVSADAYGDKETDLKNFINENAYGNAELIFGLQLGNVWNEYCNLAVDHFGNGVNSNVKTPTIVYIDSNDKVQNITFGQETANAIKNNISVYCSGEGSGSISETVYTVTYELNGGTNNVGNPAAYVKGTANIDLLAPTKEGYTFKGWYTDKELTKLKTNITDLDSRNLTLYAKWQETVQIFEYTITYVLDGGTNHADNPAVYRTGTETIILKDPARADYKFMGWYKDKARTKKITQITKANSGDMTLYAKWQENPKDPENFPQIDMTPTDGNFIIGIEGYYETATKDEILNRLNAIREEACNTGVTLPGGKKLTADDYVPLKWSSEMEAIARLRAAEAAVRLDGNHTRPSGKEWNTVLTTEKKFSMCENLALNGGGIMGAIESFYGEKEAWIKGDSSKETGHYTNMINPTYEYVGLGAFRLPNTGNYPLAIAQEFSAVEGPDVKSDRVGYCVQDIEIEKSAVKLAFEAQSPIPLEAGQTAKPVLCAKITIAKDEAIIPRELTGLFRGDVTWESSSPSVAKVDADGTITAVKGGEAQISAKSGTLLANINVTVDELVKYTVTFDVMGIDTDTKPADYTGGVGFFVSEPKEPSAARHDFVGWYKDRECTKIWDFEKDTLQSDMVLYAKWLEVAESGFRVQEIAPVYYTGKPWKPPVSVYDGSTPLKANKDYSVAYSNNVNAGTTAEAVITGKGNYTEVIRKSFEILKVQLADGNKKPANGVTVQYTEQNAVNKKGTVVPLKSVKCGRTLKKGTDYTVSVETVDAKDASGLNITETETFEDGVIPKGYSGEFKLKIQGKEINYTGTIELPIYVRESKELLKNATISIGSKVRSVKLENYVVGKKAEAKLMPAYYDETAKQYFKYDVKDDGSLVLAQDSPSKQYVEQYCFTVRSGKTYLRYGTDFDVTYSNNDKTGKASMTIVGKKDYVGSKTVTFNITGKPLSAKAVKVSNFVTEMAYTGNPLRQNLNNVTLKYGLAEMKCGTDYTVSYKNNINKGTAAVTFTAKAGSIYSGSFTKTFKITAAGIDKAISDPGMGKITVPYSRSGIDISGQIKFKNEAEQPLVLGKDYTIKYKNCSKPAPNDDSNAPTAIITGKGNYTGTKDIKFTITQGKLDSSAITVTVAPTAYDGRKVPTYEYKPKVTVKDRKSTLRLNKDYTVEYKNNKKEDYEKFKGGTAAAGIPAVVITAAEGSFYTGITKEIPLPIYETKLSSANLYVVVDTTKAAYTGSQVTPDVTAVYYGEKAKVDAVKKKASKGTLSEDDLKELTPLTKDTHYTLSYGANVNAGKDKGSVTILGKEPCYGGSATVKFTIERKKVN